MRLALVPWAAAALAVMGAEVGSQSHARIPKLIVISDCGARRCPTEPISDGLKPAPQIAYAVQEDLAVFGALPNSRRTSLPARVRGRLRFGTPLLIYARGITQSGVGYRLVGPFEEPSHHFGWVAENGILHSGLEIERGSRPLPHIVSLRGGAGRPAPRDAWLRLGPGRRYRLVDVDDIPTIMFVYGRSGCDQRSEEGCYYLVGDAPLLQGGGAPPLLVESLLGWVSGEDLEIWPIGVGLAPGDPGSGRAVRVHLFRTVGEARDYRRRGVINRSRLIAEFDDSHGPTNPPYPVLEHIGPVTDDTTVFRVSVTYDEQTRSRQKAEDATMTARSAWVSARGLDGPREFHPVVVMTKQQISMLRGLVSEIVAMADSQVPVAAALRAALRTILGLAPAEDRDAAGLLSRKLGISLRHPLWGRTIRSMEAHCEQEPGKCVEFVELLRRTGALLESVDGRYEVQQVDGRVLPVVTDAGDPVPRSRWWRSSNGTLLAWVPVEFLP